VLPDVLRSERLGARRSCGQPPGKTEGVLASLLLFMVEMAFLCWPTLINRGAVIVFYDTRPYYVGGRAALMKAIAVFKGDALGTNGGGISTYGGFHFDSLDAAVQKARAVRSVFYSLVTYVSADLLSLWLAIGVQAGIVALLLKLTFHTLFPGRPRWHATLFIIALAMLTTVSWVVSNAMPDVFTPIALLSAILVLLFWDRLSHVCRFGLFGTIVGGSIMHLTNPPIVFAVLCVGTLLQITRVKREPMRYMMLGATITVALGTTLMVSVVGFKQWTLSPNAPPFLLARSLDDGPGKLYLKDHCPQIGLDMCKHLDRLNVGADDFIWHPNGVYSAVPLDEAALLRAEDKLIYLAAALEHPWMQLCAVISNTLQQLGLFTLREYMIPSYGYPDDTNQPDGFREYFRPTEPLWQIILAVPEYLIVVSAFAYMVNLWCRGSLGAIGRSFFVLVLTALLANAVVCGFSLPSPRYGARVIWLLPMTALLFIYRSRSTRARVTNTGTEPRARMQVCA
jgi:hypothetical protein